MICELSEEKLLLSYSWKRFLLRKVMCGWERREEGRKEAGLMLSVWLFQ